MMRLLVTLSAAALGALLFELLRVPAGALVGAMVGSAVVAFVWGDLIVAPPRGVSLAAFAVLGWALGSSITRETLAGIASAWPLVIVTIVTLLALTTLLGVALSTFGGVDQTSAFLATAPGGLAHLAALSLEAKADTGLIASIHVLRVMLVVLIAPIVISLLK